MKTCEEQQAPDEMRTVLREREEAGGSLAPDGYAYASTLTCFGKVKVKVPLAVRLRES